MDHLFFCKCEALNSIPSPTKTKNKQTKKNLKNEKWEHTHTHSTLFLMLGIDPRVTLMVSTYSTTELHFALQF
jgi:hypothetical protein